MADSINLETPRSVGKEAVDLGRRRWPPRTSQVVAVFKITVAYTRLENVPI